MVKRFLRNIFLCLVSIFFTFILLECIFTVTYFFKDGRYLSVKEKLKQEENQFTNAVTAGSYADTLFPHPYLAFVHRYTQRCPIENLNSLGLFGHEYPFEKKPGTFVILVTGGSVAAQYAGLDVKDNILEQELNKHYTNDKIKKFLVLNGGDGAWGQPQQFILFSLYSDVIDGVITLDGFNEYFKTSVLPTRFEYPPKNFILSINKNAGAWEAMLLLFIDGKLYRAQRKTFLLNHSKFLYFLISSIRSRARSWAEQFPSEESRVAFSDLDKMFGLPNDWEKSKRTAYNTGQYKRYIGMIKAIADSMGVKSIFLIQPCPALEKKLSSKELKLAGNLAYGKAYAKMTNSLLGLKGFPIYSLTGLFKNCREDIYIDKIHLNKDGYRIMNEYILFLLEQEWGLRRNGRN